MSFVWTEGLFLIFTTSRLELVGKKEKRRVDVDERGRGRLVEVFWQTPEVPWQTHPFRRGLLSLISWTLLTGWR